jgi:non-ribosomal peptide synthetase-like protein
MPYAVDFLGKGTKTMSTLESSRNLNAPTAEYFFGASLPVIRMHQFFEERCDATPDALALICDAQMFTYKRLEERANRLAHYLAAVGVRPGDRVGILLDRCENLYVALLAVLKSGAAFVPIDPSFPKDRVEFIASDSSLKVLLTTAANACAHSELPCEVLELDTADEILLWPDTRLNTTVEGDSAAYIIYTSGSSGRPKGVVVNHSSICHFLEVCTPVYGVTRQDRVYQGMTLAFDFSIEEIWPTFIAGATLIAGPTDSRRFGPGLAEFLTEQEITVLYCVPTLLATLDEEIPALRTLIVGGEACPQDVVRRWSQPGRRMLNTYGPTEATVTATCGELSPDLPVTIGFPMPGYRIHLLDADLRRVARGEAGEICIGGPGVAQGYVNRPELTATKFVPNPFEIDKEGARLYRTGDLGRIAPNGEIEYLGRIDSQVKIRGYRIELAEIEAVLLEDADVKQALVTSAGSDSSAQELVAYITLSNSAEAPDAIKQRLAGLTRNRLPAYMIPAFIEIIESIPLLPSGKADRSHLPPARSPRLGLHRGRYVAPATRLEKEIAAVWEVTFHQERISVEANFFLDLGGHSLWAAQVISKLRRQPQMRLLSVADLYGNPTIRSLAEHIEVLSRRSATQSGCRRPSDGSPQQPPLRHGSQRVWSCGAVQFVLVYALLATGGVLAVPIHIAMRSGQPLFWLTFCWVALFAGLPVTLLVLSIMAKWLLLGRCRAGTYPLWGWYYIRLWLYSHILAFAPVEYLAGSPFLPVYARLLGARIGRGCHLASGQLHQPDLIEIGDNVSLGYDVDLQTYYVEGGRITLGPVSIGSGAYVGTGSAIMTGARVGRNARLGERSLLARGQSIPDDESWVGSPAQPAKRKDPLLADIEAHAQAPCAWRFWHYVAFAGGCALLDLLGAIMTLPGALILWYADSRKGTLGVLATTPLAGLAYVITACLVIACAKHLFMPSIEAGIFPLRSGFGVRKWLTDNLMHLSLGCTNTLYATLYALPWLRLLGAKVGPRAELSTVSRIDPDLLSLGEESFIGDMASIGAATFHNGYIALGPTTLGRRAFVGNSAVVRSNTVLADNSLIGVHSIPPSRAVDEGTSWLGSPAFLLPRRQSWENFDESVTYRPHARLIVLRLAIEFFRIVLPATFHCLASVLICLAVSQMAPAMLIGVLPAILLSIACLSTFLVAGLKWLIVGRYRPRVAPAWCHFVWRSELITGLYETVAVPLLLSATTGTPFLAPLLRIFGAKIGRRVYMETTYLTEFDLVDVGDDAAIGHRTSLQTHLFEDRIMKISNVVIGRNSAVGARSVVLYDSVVDAGATLDALSLVMKGETLPAGTHWCGIPAQLVEVASETLAKEVAA